MLKRKVHRAIRSAARRPEASEPSPNGAQGGIGTASEASASASAHHLSVSAAVSQEPGYLPTYLHFRRTNSSPQIAARRCLSSLACYPLAGAAASSGRSCT